MLKTATGRLGFVVALVAMGSGVHPGPDARRDAATPAPGPPGSVVLDETKQKAIWDLEHMSFVIETYIGKPFANALRARDGKKLLTFFREDFQGSIPATREGQLRRAGPVTESRLDAASTPGRTVDASGYTSHLLRYLADFNAIETVKLQVLHIDAEMEKGHWEVALLLTAIGAGQAGNPLEHVSKHRAEFRFAGEEQVKQDGRIIKSLLVYSEAHRSSSQALMEEVTDQVGFTDIPLPDNWDLPPRLVRTHRYQFAVEDYDRDGYPDIAVSATNGRPLLLHSIQGKRFEDVAESMGIKSSDDTPQERNLNALVGWIDYDNDGYPDLVMGPRLYHNRQGKRFVDVTSDSGLKLDRSPFGCVVADYDGDGLLDLYIVNQQGFRARPPGKRPWVGDPYAGTDNHLWHNEGGGRFRNVTSASNAGGGWHQTFAAASFFLDDDRFPDLYLANDFGTNVLLRNAGDGTFEDITAASGTGDFSTSMGVAAGDLDNDGDPELYVANMYSKMGRRIVAHVDPDDYPPGLYDMILGSLAGNRLYRLGSDGERFEEISEQLGINQVGWAYAPAMVDLDGDGWLDLYATAGFNSADRTKPDG